MPSLYLRVGQIFTKAVATHLESAKSINVPIVGPCGIENIQGPQNHKGGWSFTFDLRFPNSDSSMTFGVFTFGTALLQDAEELALPPADFEDEVEKEFPPEHQEAWGRLHDAVREELTSLGLSDDLESGDFYLVEDYYPSRGVSGSLLRPHLITQELASRCQRLLREHTGWDFWIQFDLEFADPKYRGKNESLLIREDRIVLDLNIDRLKREFPGEFSWGQ